MYRSRFLKRIAAFVIVIVFVLSALSCSVFADSGYSGVEVINAKYYSVTKDEYKLLPVEFSADWFKEDADHYDHRIAKLSMGLATAAFRPNLNHLEGISSNDMNLKDFLTQAHFKDLRSNDYDKNPNIYSISTVMGHQKVGEGDEAFELIAVGVCGQGYIDEWESNFSIGDGIYHDGFWRSSELVYDRIFGYIASMHLEGPYKVWISGFSRAAAVSSLTASMLSDSSMLDQKSVFAYTFATPRYVRDPNYDRYPNINNIVGKTDPIPCVPFAEWGYQRYGNTLYLPALETDSDFDEMNDLAAEIYTNLTGMDFWYNRNTYQFLKTVLGYILEICPTVNDYYEHLQNNIIHMWADRTPVNVLSNLLDLANDEALINEDTKESANGLLNYLIWMLQDYDTGESIFRQWNPNASSGVNLAHFHTPEMYIAWLFSTDSYEELYNSNSRYSEIYVSTRMPLSLERDGKTIEQLPSMFKYNEKKGQYDLIDEDERKVADDLRYMDYTDYAMHITIPRDTDYDLHVDADSEDDFLIIEMDYSLGYLNPEKVTLYTIRIPEGHDLTVRLHGEPNPEQIEETELADLLEPEFLSEKGLDKDSFSRIEYENGVKVGEISTIYKEQSSRLYWKDAVMLFLSVIIIILSFLTFQAVFFVGKIRFNRRVRKGWIPEGTKFNAIPLVCASAIFVLFLIMEFYKQILPDNKTRIYVFKSIIGFISVMIALYGYRKEKKPLSLMIVFGLVSLAVADVSMSVSIYVGSVLHILAYLLLSYAYYRDEKPEKKQVIVWIILSAIAVTCLMLIKGEYRGLRAFAIAYVITAILMVILSIGQDRRIAAGSVLLFVAGVLLINNEINGTTFISHLISLGTYYVAIIVLATSNIKRLRYRLVAETIED